MRVLILSALALAALPVVAQPATRQERVVVTVDSTADGGRFGVRRPGDRMVIRRIERDGVVSVDTVRFRWPDGDNVAFRHPGPGQDGAEFTWFERDADVQSDTVRFRFPGADVLLDRLPGLIDGPFRDAFPAPGVSEETRERMQTLDRRSRDLAREARAAEGRDRERLERELDGVLAELFDVRADARREEAAHLRERADALDAGLRDRADRREALLDARRRALLGETDGADW